MVLWEIASHQMPFEDIRFNSQVEDAVIAGRRPAIPSTVTSAYANLIASCWDQDARMRPPVSDAVLQLELLSQSHAPVVARQGEVDHEQVTIEENAPLLGEL